MHLCGMRTLLVLAALLVGCGDVLGEGPAIEAACPPAVLECPYYPEAGDTITPCVDGNGQWTTHDGIKCVQGHNRNDTLGFGEDCRISRDALWAVADCGSC